MSKLHVCIGHKHFSGGVEKLALACRLLNSGAGDSCKRDRDPDQYVCLFTYFLIDQGQLLLFPLLYLVTIIHTLFLSVAIVILASATLDASVLCFKVSTLELDFWRKIFYL